MKLEQQVCSLELANRLKELGVKQDSYFVCVPLSRSQAAVRSVLPSGTRVVHPPRLASAVVVFLRLL